jgi:hypothetical protein
MFKISLKKEKDSLTHMLNVNTNLIHVDGMICSMHPQLYAFACIKSKKINVGSENPIVNDCLSLKDRLKSRVIDTITMCPEQGFIEITDPYFFNSKIPLLEDDSLVSEAMKRVGVIEDIKGVISGNTFEDPKTKEDKAVAVFKIDNAILADMLAQIGESERLEIFTNESNALNMKNHNNGAEMAYKIECSVPATVILTEDAMKMLKSSLLQKEELLEEEEPTEKSKSKIYIVDGCFMVVVNKASTIINCMVE